MKRRMLLKSLLGITLLPLGGRVSARSADRRLLIQQSPLAGFQYHHGEAIWPSLQPGQPLQLVREPDNPYDRGAVRIDWNGHKLGYLPRVENTAVSQMLDRGEHLGARIAALNDSRSPWQRIVLEVWVEGVASG